jgi:hypothetical protein
MCVCVCIYICVCVCIYICVCVYIYIYIYNTENDTKQTIHRTTQKLGRVRTVPRLCGFYPVICLTTEEKHGKSSFSVAIHKHTMRQRIVVNLCRRFGTSYPSHFQVLFGLLTNKDWTDTLPRNTGKKLPLLAA